VTIYGLQGQAPNESVFHTTGTITGQDHNGQLALSFNSGPTVFGSIAAATVSLQLPSSLGISATDFEQGSVDTFNQAVAHLNLLPPLDNEAYAVNADQQSLIQRNPASDVQSTAGSLPALSTDEATVEQDASQTDCAGYSLASAFQTLNDDYSATAGWADNVATALVNVRSGLGSLQTDIARLQSDESAYGSTPNNVPSNNALSEAVAMFNGWITSSISSMNGYINQANATLTSAYSAAQANPSCSGELQTGVEPEPSSITPLS
jgi:hypothetical protein